MFGPGTLTGATDFILRQPRTFRVTAQEGRVRAVSMHRSEFESLADSDPEVSKRTGYIALSYLHGMEVMTIGLVSRRDHHSVHELSCGELACI